MGYCVSVADFPGISFEGDEDLPLGLETRRESFVLTDLTDADGGRLEILNEWLPFLRLYVNYLEEKCGR